MQLVVVVTDGSDVSQLAVESLELAKETGAAVTVVAEGQPLSTPYDQRELSRQLARAQAALKLAKAEAEAIAIELPEGDAANLIVPGSHRFGSIRSFLSKAVPTSLFWS